MRLIDNACAEGNTLVVSFESVFDEDFVNQLAMHTPSCVLFRDADLVYDRVRISVEQVFKRLSPTIEI